MVRYTAPSPVMLDRSYDGDLGQLVDGLRGPDHFLGSPGADGTGESLEQLESMRVEGVILLSINGAHKTS